MLLYLLPCYPDYKGQYFFKGGKSIKKILCTALGSLTLSPTYAITRVILATNDVPEYIQFWPLVARFWQEVVGARPTLAYINEKNAPLDTSLGDIIHFRPIPGIPTSMQAQAIRLMLPAMFPHDICITSDIDMIPLQKDYFINPLKNLKPDVFVVYRDGAYGPHTKRYPMCYLAAYGKVFQNIFNKESKPFDEVIRYWASHNHGFSTDEKMLTQLLHEWKHFDTHCIKLKDIMTDQTRIDRGNWGYNKDLLRKRFYIDSHMLRPYQQYKKQIDQLVKDFNLSNTLDQLP